MKKNIVIISIILVLVYFIFTNNILVSQNILNSLELFTTKVLVSLFPFIIISKLLINYNFPYYIAKFFKSPYLYIYILGLISGSPNSFIIIKDLYNKEYITLKEANTYLMCSFFTNPLFLYNMLSSFLFKKEVLLLIITSYLSNLILYFIFRSKEKLIIKPLKENNLSDTLILSIKEAMNTLIIILGTIMFFNILTLLIPKSLKSFTGILELTNGLNYLSIIDMSYILKLILAIIYINFGGLSIIMQVKLVLGNTFNFSNFLLSRFYQIITSSILFIFFELLLQILHL